VTNFPSPLFGPVLKSLGVIYSVIYSRTSLEYVI